MYFSIFVIVSIIEHEHEQDSPNVVEKKRRGGRTRFTIYQRAELEAAFTASRYLSPQQRLALAARLRVKPVAVQVNLLYNLVFKELTRDQYISHLRLKKRNLLTDLTYEIVVPFGPCNSSRSPTETQVASRRKLPNCAYLQLLLFENRLTLILD